MTLRNAMTCMLVAFIVGAYSGYRYAVDQQPAPTLVEPMSAVTPTPASALTASPAPLAAMAPAAARPMVAAPGTGADAATDGAPPARRYPPGPDPTQLSHVEFQTAVKRFFEEEGEDPAWRAATESMLTNHFYRENPLGVGSTLDSVECRASICKIEATSMEKDAQDVIGPRSVRWGELIAFYSQSHNTAAGAPMTFTLYLRPQAAFGAAAPHP